VGDPSDLSRLDELEIKLDRRLVVRVAALSQVREFLKKSEPSQRVLEQATEEFRLDVIRDEDSGDEGLSLEQLVEERTISPMIRLVDSIIFAGLERRASDIHIESRDNSVVVKFRIDGVLQQAMTPLAREFQSNLITRIKVMAELDIAERRIPQDGRFRVRYRGRPIDFRVSIMPSVHGEDAVLRILDKESLHEKFRQLRLDILGFSDRELKRFRRFIREPYGMVLVTGPTGSGKTTTLYAALSEIKTDEDKIITIEDPVEYYLRGINQIQVNSKSGMTFALGLRSILRHDPDVVLVGEIRDYETAEIAVQASLTGHLVFSTLHTNDAPGALTRLVDMGVEPYLVASSLEGVLAQRLVRLICQKCREEYQIPAQTTVRLEPGRDVPKVTWRGKGCRECQGTGYHGRTSIAELMTVTEQIQSAILDRTSAGEIRKIAAKQGMRSLRSDGWRLVLEGRTTVEEVLRATKDEPTNGH
jgi:type IV pilus assembly protein PilB